MKWAHRHEWRDAFEEVLDRHMETACAHAGIGVERLSSIVGADVVMNLWGCAFEDFLTAESDDGVNPAEDYLKRRGWKESPANRAYITALRRSVMSLYEVSDIVRGESFMARDLVRGGDPVRVTEHSATRAMKPWDHIAARIVRVGSKTVIGGGVLLMNREASALALRLVDKAREKLLSEPGAAAVAIDATRALSFMAPIFSSAWLTDALDKMLDPRLPELRNSDGEALQFTTTTYEVNPGAAAEIRAALGAIPELRPEGDSFWNWVSQTPAPAVAQPGPEGDDRIAGLATILDDGASVLGTIELNDATLVVSTNSVGRADRGRALLNSAIGHLVGAASVQRKSVEEMLAAQAAGSPRTPPPGVSPEEERQIVQQYLDQHYAKALGEKIPMLGDTTPLEAATTPEGRARLVEWLKYLENQSAAHPAGDPMAGYDLTWLWEKLGVSELRR
jgi:hypothetical protein